MLACDSEVSAADGKVAPAPVECRAACVGTGVSDVRRLWQRKSTPSCSCAQRCPFPIDLLGPASNARASAPLPILKHDVSDVRQATPFAEPQP